MKDSIIMKNDLINFKGKKTGKYLKNNKLHSYRLLDIIPTSEVNNPDDIEIIESVSWKSASEKLFGTPVKLRTRPEKPSKTKTAFEQLKSLTNRKSKK